MEIVQILIFIGVILFIVVKQYKEVTDNRPQQRSSGKDPFGEPMEDPFGQPIEDPFGQPIEDPFGQPIEDPFGQPIEDPFGQPIEDPFGETAEPPHRNPKSRKSEGTVFPPLMEEEVKRPPYLWAAPDREFKPERRRTDKKSKKHHHSAPARNSTDEGKKETAKVQTEEPIRLNNPAEARRAFIYSEIFNRKY